MNIFEFLQWCFKDSCSGIITIFVILLLLEGLESCIKAWKGKKDKTKN